MATDPQVSPNSLYTKQSVLSGEGPKDPYQDFRDEARKMAFLLRALATLLEDLSSILSTYKAVHMQPSMIVDPGI